MESHPPEPAGPRAPRPLPLQFGLRTLFLATTVLAVVFGLLRWLAVPLWGYAVVLAVLAVAAGAAIGLVAVLVRSTPDDGGSPWQNRSRP